MPSPPSRYDLLATAVRGRKLGVADSANDCSYTDGDVVYVAAGNPLAGHTVVLQAALLAAGSLEPRIVARLSGRPRARRRYLTLEAARAGDALHRVLPPVVLARIADAYRGPLPASPEESLAWAGAAGKRVPEAPEWMGTLRPLKLVGGRSNDTGEPAEDAHAGTGRDANGLPDFDDDDDSERSRILEVLSASGMQSPLADMLRKLLGFGRPGKIQAGGEGLTVGEGHAPAVGYHARVTRVVAPREIDRPAAPMYGTRYPEWDRRVGGYRRDWCAVAEFEPEPREAAHLAADDLVLLRQLAPLGMTYERHRRQPDGDALDLTALVDLAADLAGGVAGDPRIHEARLRTFHDLGVLILLDATGSTAEGTHGSQVFDHQRATVARLTAALDALGHRVGTFGFYSEGRHSVRFLHIKDFNERYDHAARLRLASLQPSGFTRLGAAVRHGAHLLTTKAGTSNMMLIVVGDGLPFDDGYEGEYAQEDSRRALGEALGDGVACACISVGSTTPDEIVERVWGHVSHMTLRHPDELSRHVRTLFRGALREAAMKTRTFERRAI